MTPSQNLLDFPHAAIGPDAIYLAGNQFQNGISFVGPRVYAYNKSQMYAGAPASAIYDNVTSNAAGHLADSLYPVLGVGAAGTAYYLAADNCNGCSTISLWKWTNPFGSSSFVLRGGVRVQTYGQPPNARQLGGSRIDTTDVRNLGGHWYNNTVYGTHAIGCNPGFGTVACVQWYQLGNLDTGTPTLVQQGIPQQHGQYRYSPNLAVDRAGNMVLAYAYSSRSDYAGIRYTGRLASDPLGTLQPEAELKRGEAPINGSRYGDYAGTALDPNRCTVWHLEEYAKSGSVWGTWVGSVRFPNC